jgi:tetratricopeptide (TPR) repeat protein
VEAMRVAQDAGQEVTAEQLGFTEAEFADLARELTDGPRPPLVAPAGVTEALATLAKLGLVAPADPRDPTEASARPAWVVHRWTAAALARLTADPELKEAHRRAARYWHWRVQVWAQDRQADIADLLEARYHLLAAGDLENAAHTTMSICDQLHTWGAWSWEERLCHETIALFPEGSHQAARFTHQLGLIGELRGDYDEASSRHRQALTLFEELGDREGMAFSYGQLGNLAQRRGDHEQAITKHQQALAILKELGNSAGMATAYHQLGIVAQERGDYDQALDWYRQSLAIKEELGNRAGMATTISQIGVLLTETGNPKDGLTWNLRSLRIRAELDSPEVSVDLRSLQRQRALLGARRFQRLLRQELGDQDSQTVMEWLQQLPDSE